jgi:cytochrome b involved in lipid metabolism
MVETKPLRIISRTEVSKNNSEASLWVIVGNHVYDLTIFLDKHPGKLGFLYGELSKKVNFSIFGRFFQIISSF